MAIHLAALSWALIFILRLRFPPGKSIAIELIYNHNMPGLQILKYIQSLFMTRK